MITFNDAYDKVMQHPMDVGTVSVPLLQASGRVLAENILADRDFPPFDRATKDGIALVYDTFEKGTDRFKIEGVASAGMPQLQLNDANCCLEIMTGAVVPINTDTVLMYEHLDINNGTATLLENPSKGQNIHKKGSDVEKGTVLLAKNTKIGAAEIGVLASVGKSVVLVKKLPRVAVISTGNELVEVHETPLPHQIRKSNTLSLFAALERVGIRAEQRHLPDEKTQIKKELEELLERFDVLLLSGGVSKGKFDFIPEVLEALGVKKIFHRVAQRPGKPFWFGLGKKTNTVVFSFPGNPVSTYANYHVYFLPWLYKSLQTKMLKKNVLLEKELLITPPLTRFIQVTLNHRNGSDWATPVVENGSGDLTSLARSDGFICLYPQDEAYKQGVEVPFISTKP